MHVSMGAKRTSLEGILNSKPYTLSSCALYALHTLPSSAAERACWHRNCSQKEVYPVMRGKGRHGLAWAVLARRPPGRTGSSGGMRRDRSRERGLLAQTWREEERRWHIVYYARRPSR